MLERLINPRSIAVVGASASPEKIGHQILNNIISGGFAGAVYPVNPKGGEIMGLKTYSDISDINEEIDLAVIAIPGVLVEAAVESLAKVKTKAIVIISAGFAEVGEDGAKRQEHIAKICREADIELLGPNCLGLINTAANVNTTFARGLPPRGNVSFISQSGATITALIDWSISSSVGFSKIFSLGNKALLKEADILEFLYKDPETSVIIGYLENLAVDDQLTHVLAAGCVRKPTIMLYGGKGNLGVRAAKSHTGAMVSSYLSVKTYLEQAGVIVAETLEDLLLYTRTFSHYRKIEGDRFAVVTNAGGLGVVVSDELEASGLAMPSLASEAQELLRTKLREEANVTNPIDVLGDADEKAYRIAIEAAVKDPQIDGVILLLTPQSATHIKETAQVISAYEGEKPLIPAFIGGESLIEARSDIEKAMKPCFDLPEEAVKAARALVKFSRVHPQILPSAKRKKVFDENQKAQILADYKLPALEYLETSEISELKDFAEKNGYPVVLKTANPEVIHKSDAGGVKLDIKDDEELESKHKELGGGPVIIGKMVRSRHELFVGAKRDSQVGTIMAFGSGGIFAEILNDMSYRVAPVNIEMATAMIRETKIGKILSGARGQKKYDHRKIAEIISNTSRLVTDFDNIAEVDFNPVLVSDDGFHIVDARIVIL